MRNFYTLTSYFDLTKVFPPWLLLDIDVFYARSFIPWYGSCGTVPFSSLYFSILPFGKILQVLPQILFQVLFLSYITITYKLHLLEVPWAPECSILKLANPYFSFAFLVQKFFHVLQLGDYSFSPAHN